MELFLELNEIQAICVTAITISAIWGLVKVLTKIMDI